MEMFSSIVNQEEASQPSYDRAVAHLEVLRSDPNTYCTVPEGGCVYIITINNHICGGHGQERAETSWSGAKTLI